MNSIASTVSLGLEQLKTTMFKEYDRFRLTQPIPGEDIHIGSVGVVLMLFAGDITKYEVEFLDGRGGNLGKRPTHTIAESQMEPYPMPSKDQPT